MALCKKAVVAVVATAALAAAVPAQAASNSIWDWLFGPASCSCKWDV
jgi:hypothetical protein